MTTLVWLGCIGAFCGAVYLLGQYPGPVFVALFGGAAVIGVGAALVDSWREIYKRMWLR